AAGSLSQSRAISGAWLAAKAPTSSAMGGLLLHRVELGDESLVIHAGRAKIKSQQISVDEGRQRGDVVGADRSENLGPERIARQHLFAVGAIFGARSRPL